MIKVMVVFYGLLVFVPQDRGLTVLFVDAGEHVDFPHVATVRVVKSNGELGYPTSLTDVFDFEDVFDFDLQGHPEADGEKADIEGPHGPKPYAHVDLRGLDDFAQLENLFRYSHRGMIRRDCLENDDSCRNGGHNPVRGRIRVLGGWTTRPATHCNGGWSPPIDFDDRIRVRFRRTLGGVQRDMRTRRLASALRLDTELPLKGRGEQLQLFGMDLDVHTRETCKTWLGEDAERCVILLIGNHPPMRPPEERGSEPDPLDRHFTAFYQLTMNPPWRVNRLLPYFYSTLECPVGYPPKNRYILNKPAPLCPPVVGTAEP